MNKKLLFIVTAILLTAPALLRAAESELTRQQMHIGAGFVKALRQNDMKAAYEYFSPSVRSLFRLDLFLEIQNNLQQTIGTPVSCKLRKGSARSSQNAAPACIYDMVYAHGNKRTSIPLELTFDKADGSGRLSSFKYLKDEMKPAGN